MFSYDGSYVPAIPRVRLRITDDQHHHVLSDFTAIIDSGADYTCIPEWVVDRTQNLHYDLRRIRGSVTHGQSLKKVFRLLIATVEFLEDDDVLLTNQYDDLKLIAIESRIGLLGRDILNHHICKLNGRMSICQIQ